MKLSFPPNPDNGMLFSPNSDLLYQYNTATKCWKRIDGVGNIELATISKPGLMSSDDFKKVRDIMIPPISTTITAEECETIFREGLVKLISSNDDLKINTDLELFKNDGSKEETEFIIHNNTVGIDFRVNIDRLIEELQNRGTLRYLSSKGLTGPQGDRGKPGIDSLDTGPIGEKGDRGKNAPFSGSLEEDNNEVMQGSFITAVVDVYNDIDNPKIIRVKIGYIGNLKACPNRVKWKNKNSPWLMCLSAISMNCNTTGPCKVCDSSVLYINTEPILLKLQERYEEIINTIKEEKEALLRSWLNRLIEVFNAQKQAVCCALESVSSRDKNQEIRNIWSNARYQSAQAGYAFDVTDQIEVEKPRDIPKQVPSDFWPIDSTTADQKIIFSDDANQPVVNHNCDNCYVQVEINNTNLGENKSINFDLPAGGYVATVVDCCLGYDGIGATAVFSLSFFKKVVEGGSSTEIREKVKLYDRGFFTNSEASDKYIGSSISFEHTGGNIEIYSERLSCLSVVGKVVLCIQPDHCFQGANYTGQGTLCDPDFIIKGFGSKSIVHDIGLNSGTVSIKYNMNTVFDKISVYYPPIEKTGTTIDNLIASTDFVKGIGVLSFAYTYEESKSSKILVVTESSDPDSLFRYSVSCPELTPEPSGLQPVSSLINISHLEFYERGWRTSNCCGAYISVYSSKFLIVFRSIGTDCSCGGGEYGDTPFISTFYDLLGAQVAIAWPTIDGDLFFGLPRGSNSTIEFIYDEELSNLIIDQIINNPIRIIGDVSKIERIVVPVIT